MEEQGVTFPVLHDPGGSLYNSYYLAGSISPFPRDYIIDQNGVFVYTNVEYNINEMALVIESLLDDPTKVDDSAKNAVQPANFELGQNYPNPFNPTTRFEYTLVEPAFVDIGVYNVMGRQIKQLVKRFNPAGTFFQEWNGVDDNGEKVPSGVYFYNLKSGGKHQQKKMMLLR